MSLFEAILIIILLILTSTVISLSEIALAGARRLKLQAMANAGDLRAERTIYHGGTNWVEYDSYSWWCCGRKCD